MTEHDPEELFNKLVTLMGVITGLFFSVSILHRYTQGNRLKKILKCRVYIYFSLSLKFHDPLNL